MCKHELLWQFYCSHKLELNQAFYPEAYYGGETHKEEEMKSPSRRQVMDV